MSEDFKECKCGKPTTEIRVQNLWNGRQGTDLCVVYCRYCNEFEPFKVNPWERDKYMSLAVEAWNNSLDRE